jgi:YbbR domain-containing protein
MLELGALDVGRGILALALSAALWLVVQGELNPERSDLFELQVEARNVPSGLVITNEADWRVVQVRLSAPRDVFAQLRPNQLRAYVDLNRASPGETRVPVTVPVPDAQVRVGEPNPRAVVVRLEELTSKTVPVRARLEGSLPFGYRPGRPAVSPETLTINGPASYVRRVDAAQVDVRLDTATADVDSRLQPALVDGQGERLAATAPGLQVQPPTVRVQLPITQQVGYKEVGVHPVLRGAVPAGYWVERVAVEPAVVTVIGEPQLLGDVAMVDTEPVDLSAATAGFTRQATVQVPPGLSLARPEPVAVSVQIAPLALRQSLRVPVSLQNVASELFLRSEVPIVELTASGPADDGLSAAEVQASVDAAGLGPGTYTLAVRARVPDRYVVEDVRPTAVRVVLEDARVLAPVPPPPPEPVASAPAPEPTASPTEAPATPTPRPTDAPPIAVDVPTLSPTPMGTPTPTATARVASPSPTRTVTPTPRATPSPVGR